MSLQGPILIVADKPSGGLAQAFTDAGAFPIVEASWAGAPTAAAEIKPSAIVLSEPDDFDRAAAAALTRHAAGAVPLIPMFIRVREDMPAALPGAIAIADDAPAEQLIARVVSALRLRTLHSAVLGRAKSLKDERNIVAELPEFRPRPRSAGAAGAGGAVHPNADIGNHAQARLSLARFSFDNPIDRRTSMDAARLVSRLVRDVDFACRQDDGSILFAFGDTDLRDAHVVARRLASVLKHTMLRADRERPGISPSVTLATLKPSDTMHTLLARVSPRPVAAARLGA